MTVSLKLAKMALQILPRMVRPDDVAHSDFFEPSHLSRLTREQINSAMHAAAQERRTVEETDRFLERFFSPSIEQYLRGKRVLDFSCYFGGTAIAWEKMYGTGSIAGFDVSPIYIEGAKRYAEKIGSEADFRHGYGQRHPSRTMHLILSSPSTFLSAFIAM